MRRRNKFSSAATPSTCFNKYNNVAHANTTSCFGRLRHIQGNSKAALLVGSVPVYVATLHHDVAFGAVKLALEILVVWQL